MAYLNGKRVLTAVLNAGGKDYGNNYSMAYNLVVNRNGYQFNGYKFAEVTIAGFEGYTIKQFQVSTTSAVVTDLAVIKAYLSVITGHDRLPVYDEDKPSDEYVILTSNSTVWKLQYDETYGLLAFQVTNIPYLW